MFASGGVEPFFERFGSLSPAAAGAGAFAALPLEGGITVVGPPLSRSHPLLAGITIVPSA